MGRLFEWNIVTIYSRFHGKVYWQCYFNVVECGNEMRVRHLVRHQTLYVLFRSCTQTADTNQYPACCHAALSFWFQDTSAAKEFCFFPPLWFPQVRAIPLVYSKAYSCHSAPQQKVCCGFSIQAGRWERIKKERMRPEIKIGGNHHATHASQRSAPRGR